MLIDKYKLIVFDLDGTLVHTTAEYRYYVVTKVLELVGVSKKVKFKQIDKFWFDGNRNTTIKKDFGCDKDMFWKIFHKQDKIEERAKYTHVYDDVHEAIIRLKKLGKLLAITTGAPKAIATMETQLIPKDKFDKITSITSTRYKAKPHPESLIGCLKALKIKAGDAVYIGNSIEDGEYAILANVDFIYLERHKHSFSSHFTYTIPTLKELFK